MCALFIAQYRSDLLSSVQNDVGFGNEGTEEMQKCSRSVPSKPRNGFERNERALGLVLRQRSRGDAGGKKIQEAQLDTKSMKKAS